MSVCLKKIINLMFLLIFLLNSAYSAQVEEEKRVFSPTHSKYASWVFLGMVENEIGEVYNYFFQLQRNDKNFHARVALFDYQTKKIIFDEDSEATIENPENFKWLVGRAFLRYYKISNSWVFGLKVKHKQGFNFKVSMLNKPEDYPVTKYFSDGISFVVVQVGQLNGHVNVGESDKDQFVTAKNTWFRQIWLKNEPGNSQSLNSLLCRFNDGRGLYSIRVLDAEKVQDSIAGFFDNDGKAMRVSQFINIYKGEDSNWNIKIVTPKMSLQLTDIYQQSDIVAGYIANNDAQGFCMLSRDFKRF